MEKWIALIGSLATIVPGCVAAARGDSWWSLLFGAFAGAIAMLGVLSFVLEIIHRRTQMALEEMRDEFGEG